MDLDYRKMIIPLFVEQLLTMLVGMADTLVVSHVGEAAVSGVALVNQFNTIFIYLFTALASGGAVVISQYIGKNDSKSAGKAAGQLALFALIFSIVITVLVLIGNVHILRLMFGRVDDDVLEASVTYLRISAYSYTSIAVYNAGAAVYRSMGKTLPTMYISAVSNVINIVGNLIGVFVLKMGVAGVAYPSLISRAFCAVSITVLCFDKRNLVSYHVSDFLQIERPLMRSILGVAVPNGLENGIFQLVKVALSSIVALFGTYQIAANGVAQSIWSVAAIAGISMGPVFTTVIGQYMGRHDTVNASIYLRKLTVTTVKLSSAWNAILFAVTPLVLQLYALEADTKLLVIWLVLIHNVFNALVYPFSGALSYGLRAAGDVRFTMYVSVASTILVRLVLSYILGITCSMGVYGIAIAMVLDWTVRGVIFTARALGGRWKNYEVICDE